MFQLGSFLHSKIKGIASWALSLGVIAFLISFVRQLLKRRAVQTSEKKAASDKANVARKIELVETEWDRIGKEVDQLREDK